MDINFLEKSEAYIKNVELNSPIDIEDLQDAYIRGYQDGMLEQRNAELTHAISNLLAVMHGDGGHYVEKHGMIKAIEDAQGLLHSKWVAKERVDELVARVKDLESLIAERAMEKKPRL